MKITLIGHSTVLINVMVLREGESWSDVFQPATVFSSAH